MATEEDSVVKDDQNVEDDQNGLPSLTTEIQPTSGTRSANSTETEDQRNMFDVVSDTAASQWKKALSGALDEGRLFCALIVLGIFYIVFINASAYHKSNRKDEDYIARNCTCEPSHRKFYISWSVTCWAIWLICHCTLAIPQVKTYFCIKSKQEKNNKLPCCSIRLLACCYKKSGHAAESCLCFVKNKYESSQETLEEIACCCCSFSCMQVKRDEKRKDKIDHFYCLSKKCSFEGIFCCCFCCCKDFRQNIYETIKDTFTSCLSHAGDICGSCFPNISYSCSKLKQTVVEHTRIRRYEYYLWTKYYELYIVGTAKEDETITLKSIDKYVKTKSRATDETDAAISSKHTEKTEEKYTSALPDSLQFLCSYIAQVFLHLFLFVIQFVAQFAVIPLFTLQIFDTYAFLCFVADSFCSRTDESILHFHQTVITFLFYFSLMASFLASTMLRWIPWPNLRHVSKPDSERDATT